MRWRSVGTVPAGRSKDLWKVGTACTLKPSNRCPEGASACGQGIARWNRIRSLPGSSLGQSIGSWDKRPKARATASWCAAESPGIARNRRGIARNRAESFPHSLAFRPHRLPGRSRFSSQDRSNPCSTRSSIRCLAPRRTPLRLAGSYASWPRKRWATARNCWMNWPVELTNFPSPIRQLLAPSCGFCILRCSPTDGRRWRG